MRHVLVPAHRRRRNTDTARKKVQGALADAVLVFHVIGEGHSVCLLKYRQNAGIEMDQRGQGIVYIPGAGNVAARIVDRAHADLNGQWK